MYGSTLENLKCITNVIFCFYYDFVVTIIIKKVDSVNSIKCNSYSSLAYIVDITWPNDCIAILSSSFKWLK